MTHILLVRHGQASFGAADYDVLSEIGHEQARALGESLALMGQPRPRRVYRGAQRRHAETLAGLAPPLGIPPVEAIIHEGLNEFDARGLILARLGPDGLSGEMRSDRRAYFRMMRDTVLAWQRDEIDSPPESWTAFSDRVAAALDAMRSEPGPVLAVSSGGAISRILADVLNAPAAQMIHLQLQMKNCAVSRLAAGLSGLFLQSFNETPHLCASADTRLLTYS